MNLNIALSYGALLMQVSLLLVFFPKIKVKSIRTKLFSIAIVCATFFVISDIANVMIHSWCNIEIIGKIAWMYHWVICCVAVYFFSLYVLSVAYNLSYDNIKDVIKHNFLTKFETIYLILIPIIYVIFFFDHDFDINNISYISKEAMSVPGPFVFILGFSYLIEMFRHKENSTRNERFGVIFQMIVMTGGLVFQVLFPYYSTIPITMVLTSYCSYFFGDNPDILLLKDIKSTKSVIDESNKVKTNFLSNMSEGIKNPCEVITSLSNELKILPIDNIDKRIEIVDKIKSSGYSLLDTVNNVLDACIVDGTSALQNKKYNTVDLLNNLVISSKTKLGAKKVKFIVDIDESISASLIGDYSKLQQSVLNLLINAIENTSAGRITFTVTSVKKGNIDELTFKIADTGCGMDEEKKKNLFDRELSGTGLGVLISKQYVEMMNGKIWFDSEYEVGTTFYIQVPQVIDNASPMGKIISNEPQEKQYLNCRGYTILLVDDDGLNTNITKRFLEKYNFTVEIVSSGFECLNNIKMEKKYDLIITDYSMPNMNGKELLDALKALDGYDIPPIVVLTANAITGMKEKFIKEGFNDYLAKPINISELDRIINSLFKK